MRLRRWWSTAKSWPLQQKSDSQVRSKQDRFRPALLSTVCRRPVCTSIRWTKSSIRLSFHLMKECGGSTQPQENCTIAYCPGTALLRDVDRHLPGVPHEHVHHLQHHLAHAASAYYTSGWDECLVVVIDGMGEVHSASIYHARDGKLKKLRDISAMNSIGILYSLITMHLGFDFNGDEYKVMGLAPYGNAGNVSSFFEKAVEFLPNGSIRIPILALNHTREDRENYRATRRYLDEALLGPRRRKDEEIQLSPP